MWQPVDLLKLAVDIYGKWIVFIMLNVMLGLFFGGHNRCAEILTGMSTCHVIYSYVILGFSARSTQARHH